MTFFPCQPIYSISSPLRSFGFPCVCFNRFIMLVERKLFSFRMCSRLLQRQPRCLCFSASFIGIYLLEIYSYPLFHYCFRSSYPGDYGRFNEWWGFQFYHATEREVSGVWAGPGRSASQSMSVYWGIELINPVLFVLGTLMLLHINFACHRLIAERMSVPEIQYWMTGTCLTAGTNPSN